MKYSLAFIEKCLQASTADIGHFTYFGFMDVGIHAIYPGARMAGPARTVQLPGSDATSLRTLLEQIEPGEVVVVDRLGDNRFACWGDIAGLRARSAGAVGVVIDGAATDPAETEALGFPTFARSISPGTTRRLGVEGRVNVDVCAGGVVVHPGDLVIGDANGVVVLAPGEAEELVEEALKLKAKSSELVKQGIVPPPKMHNEPSGS